MADTPFDAPVILSDKADRGDPVYLYAICIIAALGGLLYGFVLGVISGVVPFITDYFKLSPYQVGFAVGNLDLGCIVGALLAGVMSDRFGRKKALIFTAILFFISGVMTALPRTFTELVIGRLIGGVAVGASMISALYIAEVAPAGKRGLLVTLTQFGIVIGILATYITNWLLVDIGPDNWRWMFACGIFPAAIFLIGLIFVPESPRWLANRGRVEKALAILTRIGGARHAETEMQEIRKAVEDEKGSVRELFRPGLRKALVIGILISVFAQSVGINSVIYYAPVIFMKTGFESASAALFAVILVGFINFSFTILALFTIDRFGRKPLLMVGLAGMFLSMGTMGLFFQSDSISASLILIPVLAFVAFYAMSLGPIAWVIVSEIFPNRIRGVAMAISMIALYLADFLVALTFPRMMDKLGHFTFFIFAGVCVLAFLFTWFVVFETKGKSLEEIEKMLVGPHPMSPLP
jgi:MFS transporter, SP family, arabinose:H+ symporter